MLKHAVHRKQVRPGHYKQPKRCIPIKLRNLLTPLRLGTLCARESIEICDIGAKVRLFDCFAIRTPIGPQATLAIGPAADNLDFDQCDPSEAQKHMGTTDTYP